MKKSKIFIFAAGLLVAVACSGCGKDESMTKAQEDAIRNPTTNPNYKGHDPSADARLKQEIADYRKKHEHDKVEFVK